MNEANKIKNGWHPIVKTTVNDALVRSCALSSGNPFVTLYIYILKQLGGPVRCLFLFCPKLRSFWPVSQSGVCFEDLMTQMV